MESRTYWKRVHKRAWAETAQLLGLDSRVRIMLKIAIALIIVLSLLFWGSQDAARDEFIVRIAIVAVIFLAVPFVYAWKIVSVPSQLDQDLQEENIKLTQDKDTIDRKGQFSEIIARSLAMGQGLYDLFNELNDMFLVSENYIPELQEITKEWRMYIHDLLLESLGPAEAVLALDDSGYVFYADSADYQEQRIIDGRNRRLVDLIKRLNSLSISADFNYPERRIQLFALDRRLTDLVTAFSQSSIRKL